MAFNESMNCNNSSEVIQFDSEKFTLCNRFSSSWKQGPLFLHSPPQDVVLCACICCEEGLAGACGGAVAIWQIGGKRHQESELEFLS